MDRLSFPVDVKASVLIPNDGSISIESDYDLACFPAPVIELSGFDLAEVLSL
jgi:hypothetical protein